MDHKVSILQIDNVTHDVRCYKVERPAGYAFTPGQATDVCIDKPGWETEKRPFTFTALADKPYLEFTIKSYPERKGVTHELSQLQQGDCLIISDAWGAIAYKGPGYFIAGGAGITPFIAILRELKKQNATEGNKLFFSNKTGSDIIYEKELVDILGARNIIFVTTNDPQSPHDHRYINEDFLMKEVKDFKKHFYLCGPDAMTSQITETLLRLGAIPDEVVFEK
jgi:ferredoxin-NADP reductase